MFLLKQTSFINIFIKCKKVIKIVFKLKLYIIFYKPNVTTVLK